MPLAWGARPPRAPWDAPSRPTRRRDIYPPFGVSVRACVRCEGAPNHSRGNCAPRELNCMVASERARPGGYLLAAGTGAAAWRGGVLENTEGEMTGGVTASYCLCGDVK